MKIPTNLIPGFYESTRPVVVYRNKDGSFRSGFVMRDNEAVVNLSFLMRSAGLQEGQLMTFRNSYRIPST
ncbi:hypothetical protein ECZC10_54470 [Escherichia coli]|nr:hypothetical protein ECZC10_54470 [Escherichia coli]